MDYGRRIFLVGYSSSFKPERLHEVANRVTTGLAFMVRNKSQGKEEGSESVQPSFDSLDSGAEQL